MMDLLKLTRIRWKIKATDVYFTLVTDDEHEDLVAFISLVSGDWETADHIVKVHNKSLEEDKRTQLKLF